MNVHACSFASAGFIRQQALQIEAFKDVGFPFSQIYDCRENILTDSFTNKNPHACELNRFGYFSFKPYFIEQLLSSIPDGDILLYLDVNDCPRHGIIDYIQAQFMDNTALNILVPGTNHTNSRHMSWYHREHLGYELQFSSNFICQPEAGALAVRNTLESRALLRTWFELTLIQALALLHLDDPESRHDQETLYLISRLNKSVKIESWWRFKLTGNGLRKYIDWEFFRHG